MRSEVISVFQNVVNELGTDKYKVPTETCDKHTEETSKITIPNVVGKTEAQAKTALAGLNIQVIYETHSDKANGTVLRQSLAEGTKVDKGVSIVITVNESGLSPFYIIPNAYKILMTNMKINGIKQKNDRKVLSCFEREYYINGKWHMDIHIAIE